MARTTATFLGTGNFFAPASRFWNSFVVEDDERSVLVEPSPTSLPQLRRAGIATESLDAIVISHFHPDHTFGWPFLLLELVQTAHRRTRPLDVIGPPGVEAFLDEMMQLGSVADIVTKAEHSMELRFVEVAGDGSLQQAAVDFRAVRVDHVPELECFGYVLDFDGLKVGYSGDTLPCAGLEELASSSDVLVLECNGRHPSHSHMDVGAVLSIRVRYPDLVMIATHVGPNITADLLPGIRLPDDLDVIQLAATTSGV